MTSAARRDRSGILAYKRAGEAVELTLCRGEKHNALDAGLVGDLSHAICAAHDEGARVIILRGRGPSFCAGHDLKASPLESAEAVETHIGALQNVSRLLRSGPAATVALVHGYAIGAGCELALSCDFIVATPDATFRLPEVSLGLGIGGGATLHLVLALGQARASELLLLGEPFSGREALSWGLVSKLASASGLDSAGRALANALVHQPASSLGAARACMRAALDPAYEVIYETEARAMVRLQLAADEGRVDSALPAHPLHEPPDVL